HAVDVVELRVPGRAGAVPAQRDAPYRRDLGGDLGLGEHAAQPRLGALAELDLDGTHRRRGDEVLEPGQVERAALVAAAEVGGADLEDQLATVPVVPRDAALAGVVQGTGHRAAAVDRLDRR